MFRIYNARAFRQYGFTIVELLIVIVVIAILAAITLAVFDGIRTRTENTKTINSVAAHARAIMAYTQQNDTYPGLANSWHCMPDSDTLCLDTSSVAPSCFGLNRTIRISNLDND